MFDICTVQLLKFLNWYNLNFDPSLSWVLGAILLGITGILIGGWIGTTFGMLMLLFAIIDFSAKIIFN